MNPANSKNLKAAVSNYMQENNFNDDKKAELSSNINDYFNNRFENNQDIELASISAILNPEQPNDFTQFVEENDDFQVSGNFRVTKKSDFYMFHRAKLKGEGFSIEFERNLIRQGKVKREGNNLTFIDLPKDELDKEFNN